MSKPENQTPPPPWLLKRAGRCPLCHTESKEVIESNTRKAALAEIQKRWREFDWAANATPVIGGLIVDANFLMEIVVALLAPASPAAPETTTAEEAEAIAANLKGDSE